MQERPDDRAVVGGLEGTASEQEGVPALEEERERAEGASRTERAAEHGRDPGDEPPTPPGVSEAAGPLPDEPDSATRDG